MAISTGEQRARELRVVEAWNADPLALSVTIEDISNASSPTVYKYYPFPCYGFKMLYQRQIARQIDLHPDCDQFAIYRSMNEGRGDTLFYLQAINLVYGRIHKAGGADVCRNIARPQEIDFWNNPPERVAAPQNKVVHTKREPASMKEQLEIKFAEDGTPRIGNLRECLAPVEMLDALEDVLEYGAEKHGTHDWADYPSDWSHHYNAVLRHLMAWQARKGPDNGSGKSPLAHAVARLSFLIALEEREIGYDDRPGK